jgi:hypothetical protein
MSSWMMRFGGRCRRGLLCWGGREADSSAALRNDSQKGKSKSKGKS